MASPSMSTSNFSEPPVMSPKITSANLNDHWGILIFRMFIAIVSIAGNVIILYISLRYKDFRKSTSNCLIALLALGDLSLGFGLFIRGLYSIQVIFEDISIYDTTFCIWISLPQIYGIAFSYIQLSSIALDRCLAIIYPIKYAKHKNSTQLWLSAIIGFICPTVIFAFSLSSDLHSQTTQCAIGSATKLFDKISSIYAFINAAIVILLYSIALFFLHKRLSRSSSTGSSMEAILKTEKRVFTYVSIILSLYLFFCIFPVISLLILQSYGVSVFVIGYFSLFAGLGSGINSCIGIFVYLRKHNELQKYLKEILPEKLFKTLAGNEYVSTKIAFIQSTLSHHR